jgi:hypothetical protein
MGQPRPIAEMLGVRMSKVTVRIRVVSSLESTSAMVPIGVPPPAERTRAA